MIIRTLINTYRYFQYFFCGRSRFGVMQPGEGVEIEHFRYEENHGDVVHPCVRYIPESFEGYKWWMVYTPYYGADSSMENPILCYSDEEDPNTPPIKWKVYGLVNEKPIDGYNSDPTLLYKEGQLFVYWRENYELSKTYHKYIRATYMAKVNGGSIERIGGEILYTTNKEIDAETCPTFMLNEDGTVTAYAMHLKFHSERIRDMRPRLKRMVRKLVAITDLLGFYSQQKHYGIAIWKQQNKMTDSFVHEKTLKINKCNVLYRPWHMDLFDYEGCRYAVIQTNQCNADIVLAHSEDGETFTMYSKPLITNETLKMLGIYKPCAGVTKNGMFYLYYTAQEKNNRSHNKLFMTSMPFVGLIDYLRR